MPARERASTITRTHGFCNCTTLWESFYTVEKISGPRKNFASAKISAKLIADRMKAMRSIEACVAMKPVAVRLRLVDDYFFSYFQRPAWIVSATYRLPCASAVTPSGALGMSTGGIGR